MAGVNAELVTEFAKDKTWENNQKALANQVYVFGKQLYRITRCQDDVDVIVTKKYNPKGRNQTEEESDKIAVEVKEMLNKYCVDYIEADGILESADVIADTVLHYYLKR